MNTGTLNFTLKIGTGVPILTLRFTDGVPTIPFRSGTGVPICVWIFMWHRKCNFYGYYGFIIFNCWGPFNGVVLFLLCKTPCKNLPFLLLLGNWFGNIVSCLLLFPFIMIAGSNSINWSSPCGICKIGAVNVMRVFVSLTTISLLSVDRWVYLMDHFWYSKNFTP